MELTAAICAGFIIDMCLGDPENWPHPVRGIGWLITVLEKKLRQLFPKSPGGELAAGAVLAALVPAITGLAAGLILQVPGWIAILCSLPADDARVSGGRFFLLALMSWQLLAVRSLRVESMRVYDALKQGDREKARQAVSRIVGRDTDRLTEDGIIRAAVETVAENASDGAVAPLFYLLLFGPVGGFLYKAVNTMDSMVGYRNERYLYFGRAAARLDDLVNLIPSRLTALYLILTAWLLPGFSGKNAFRIWRRDRRCHKSPNSAQGEAACAGALGIQLAGDAWYFGELYHKPTIGDRSRPVEAEDIVRVNRLMTGSVVLALATGVALRLLLLV